MSRTATSDVANQILNLAETHHITAERDAISRMATAVTLLAGDAVELDYIEQLLVNLKKRGVLTKAETLKLAGRYLHEKRQRKQHFTA